MYHVVGDGWQPGEDLLSYDAHEERYGEPPAWKWDGEPFDTDVVCVFDTLDEARDFRDTFASGARVLAICVDDDEDRLRWTRVDEGYRAVFRCIPADLLTVLAED